jgi:hypothetical protein
MNEMVVTYSMSQENWAVWEMQRAWEMKKIETDGVECDGVDWIHSDSENGHKHPAYVVCEDHCDYYASDRQLPKRHSFRTVGYKSYKLYDQSPEENIIESMYGMGTTIESE